MIESLTVESSAQADSTIVTSTYSTYSTYNQKSTTESIGLPIQIAPKESWMLIPGMAGITPRGNDSLRS